MNELPSREAVLLGEALALPASQREAYLNEACGGDAHLRRAVQALLDANEDAGAFLETASTGGRLLASAAIPLLTAAENSVPITEKPGDKIGRYKLLQQIGEGGCGVVHMAEQKEPVRRRVALKVIKLGMDTKSVIARFEAERQALAMMEHPNIAKVLDAGATETGRPYFVMELVRGIKITEYCDQLKLSTRERLNLFISVCQAVQHAHQKGIIHRDLKPSNILVTEHDGVAVPKIIDFGIAKATSDQRLTDKTLFTAFEQFIGTPAYTSPEQAGLGGLDIDTRSDIYSLGVLLYELLTGQPPFSAAAFQRSAIDEVLRVIRESEPPRPSARLTTLSQRELTTVAQQRQIESGKLPALVRGDLDWIVMKCLEKDRTRRYETANGLAADIQRHLNHEPVVACPPGNLYRFQKLVRRNKVGFAAAAGIAAALVIGLGVSTWMFFKERIALNRAIAAEQEQVRLRRQADLARSNEVTLRVEAETARTNEANHRIRAQIEGARSEQIAQFLKNTLEATGPSYARGRDTTMLREILDATATRISKELTNQFEVQADLLNTIGMVCRNIGENEKAEAMFRQALAAATNAWPGDHPIMADTLRNLSGVLHRNNGSPAEARAQARQALEMSRRLWTNEHPAVAACLINFGWTLYYVRSDDADGDDELEASNTDQAKPVEAERVIREGLALNQKLLGKESSQAAASFRALGLALFEQGKLDDAESALREARHIWEDVLHEEHRELPWCFYDLAKTLKQKGNLAAAEAVARAGWEKRKRLMGAMDPDLHHAVKQLGSILKQQGRFVENEALYREWIKILQDAGMQDRGRMAGALSLLAGYLSDQKRHADAVKLGQQALGIYQKLNTNANHAVALELNNVGGYLQRRGQNSEAEKVYSQAVEMERRLHTNDHEHVALCLNHLGSALFDQQKWTEAQTAFQEGLAIERSLHANASPSIATALNNIAVLLSAQNKFADAEPFYRDALEVEKALRTNEHRIASGYRDLAHNLKKQGKLAELESLYRDRVEKGENSRTPESQLAFAFFQQILADALREQGKPAEAEKHYTRVLEIRRELLPSANQLTAGTLQNLGDAVQMQGKLAEAETSYREAFAMRRKVLGDPHDATVSSLTHLATVMEKQGKQRELQQFLEKLPTGKFATPARNAGAFTGRAHFFARRGRWKEADEDLARAIELEPTNHWSYCLRAPLLAITGKREEHLRLCQEVLVRFGTTDDPKVAEQITKASLMLPQPSVNPGSFDKLADMAASKQKTSYLVDWAWFAKGLNEYRQGRFSSALEWTEKAAAKPRDPRLRTANYAVLAMAHHRLEHADAARVALAKSTDTERTELPKLQDSDLPINWHDWLLAHVLLDEATALMKDDAKTTASKK